VWQRPAAAAAAAAGIGDCTEVCMPRAACFLLDLLSVSRRISQLLVVIAV